MLKGARLLVVEDDILLLMELESLLGDAGAESVVACASVGEALAAIDRSSFAGAVLDWRLGHETAAPVARRLASRNVPFVFYTAQTGMTDFREWPGSIIVPKPARPRDIVAALAKVLWPAAPASRTG